MQESLSKNVSEELELKENTVKGAVRIVSKTNPYFSFLLNRKTLDTAEEEGKHGNQKEDPPLLWLSGPLRYQALHM